MKTPRVSVLMAVYNTPVDFLKKSIESILTQTFYDFEFIIIDDGSTQKDIKNTILSYNDKRIRYFYQKNIGLPGALNNGLNKCSGKYIARMDSDDIARPDRLKKQVDFLDNNPDVGIVGSLFQTFGKKRYISDHPFNVTVMTLLKGCYIGHPTVMFRKDIFDKYNLRYNLKFKCAQDYELWSRAVRVTKIVNIQEVLLDYRISEINISQKRAEEQNSNAHKVRNSILLFLSDDKNIQEKLYDIVFPKQKKSIRKLLKRFLK